MQVGRHTAQNLTVTPTQIITIKRRRGEWNKYMYMYMYKYIHIYKCNLQSTIFNLPSTRSCLPTFFRSWTTPHFPKMPKIHKKTNDDENKIHQLHTGYYTYIP